MKLSAAVLLSMTLAFQPLVHARDKWVTSWYASPQPVWGQDFILPTNIPSSLRGQSVREVIRASAGGREMRILLSNRYGTTPLTIGEVSVATSTPGASRTLTFGGHRGAIVPPGAPIVSDPVELAIAPLEELTVTTHFPAETPLTTFHWGAQQTGHIAQGTSTVAFSGRLFLSALLVRAPDATRTVVAFGDSITDGNGSTPNLNRRWPDYLAERFTGQHVAVANAGISGARVLADRMGVNALARFEQDVLSQPGVATVILLMGINDIGWPGSPFAPHDRQLRVDELIDGYRQLIASARAHQVRIVGATLPPFEGALEGTPFAGHFSAEKEKTRQAVNHWIRTADAFDAVVDFDALLRDPAHPTRLDPAFDSGDHLHPGDRGYRAMANAVGLPLLFGHSAICAQATCAQR